MDIKQQREASGKPLSLSLHFEALILYPTVISTLTMMCLNIVFVLLELTDFMSLKLICFTKFRTG